MKDSLDQFPLDVKYLNHKLHVVTIRQHEETVLVANCFVNAPFFAFAITRLAMDDPTNQWLSLTRENSPLDRPARVQDKVLSRDFSLDHGVVAAITPAKHQMPISLLN
ncbi:MAG: hypothetical protein ACI97A_003240 [Planctomycetota bacterium]|jgi:hypothetical protein